MTLRIHGFRTCRLNSVSASLYPMNITRAFWGTMRPQGCLGLLKGTSSFSLNHKCYSESPAGFLNWGEAELSETQSILKSSSRPCIASLHLRTPLDASRGILMAWIHRFNYPWVSVSVGGPGMDLPQIMRANGTTFQKVHKAVYITKWMVPCFTI